MADWGKKRSELRRQEASQSAPAPRDWGREARALRREREALQGAPLGPPALQPEQDPALVREARKARQEWDNMPTGTVGGAVGQAYRGALEQGAGVVEFASRFGQGMKPEQYPTTERMMDAAVRAGIAPAAEQTPTKWGEIGRGAGGAALDTALFALPAAGLARAGYGTGKAGQFLMGNYLTRSVRVGVEDAAAPGLRHVAKEAAKDIGYGAAGGAGGVLGEGETGSTFVGGTGGNVIGTAAGAGLFKALTKAGNIAPSVAGRIGRSIAGSERAVATLESLGAGSFAEHLKANREAFFSNLGRERAAEALRRATPDLNEALTHISAAERIAKNHPGARLNLAQTTGNASHQTMLDDRVRRSSQFRDRVEKQKEATDSIAFGELEAQYPQQPGGTRMIQKMVEDSVNADLGTLRSDLEAVQNRVLSMRRNVSSPENQSEALSASVQGLVETTKARVDAMYAPFNRHGNKIEIPAARNRLRGWFQEYTGQLGRVEARSLSSGKAMTNPAVADILNGEDVLTFADLKASRESINKVLRDSPDLGYTEQQLLTRLKSEVDATLNDAMSSGQFTTTDLDPESVMELYAGARRFEDEAWRATNDSIEALRGTDSGLIAENYRAANAAHRERKQVLGPDSTPTIGRVTGEGRRVRPQQEVPAADVGRQLLKPGGDSRQRVSQFRQMIEYARANGGGLDRQLERGAREYLIASAYQKAGFDSGLPNPIALDKWRTEHEAALSLFPDVDMHLRDVSSARRYFDDNARTTADAISTIERSVASDFIGRPVDEAADAILNAKGRTPVEAAGEVLARVQGHPDARAGLSRAFAERLLANTKRVTTENASDVISGGHVSPDFKKMRDMLTDKEDVLRHVWGSQRYEATSELVSILDRNRVATKAGTSRDLGVAEAKQNLQKVSRWAEGARDRLDKPGVIPFGERGARLIDMLSESFPDKYTAEVLERALLDPTAARALLMEGDELIRSEPNRLFRMWIAGVATSALRDMEKEKE